MKEIAFKDIKWHPKTNKLSQVPKEGLEYALISKDYEQIHQLVWCKDFLQDAVFSQVTNQSIEIWGFTHDPKTSPAVDLSKTRIIVTNFKDSEFSVKLLSRCMPLLHHVEKRLRITKTTVFKCRRVPPIYNRAGVWLLEGNKRWLQSPPMLSFYTYLIRIGLVCEPNDTLEQTLDKLASGKIMPYYDNDEDFGWDDGMPRDQSVAKSSRNGINRIMKFGDKDIFSTSIKKNYPKIVKDYYGDVAMDIATMHDDCGIVGFSEGDTKHYFPNWHNDKVINA